MADLVCPNCNGKGRVYWCSKRGDADRTGIPSYSSEVCRVCRGEKKTGTDSDRPRQPDPDPLDEYLSNGGRWD